MAAPVGLIHSKRFLEHDPGPGHPERPDRLRAIEAALRQTGLWARLTRLPFQPADLAWIERIHDRRYIDRVFAVCEHGERWIDSPDCGVAPLTAEIAQLAVGGVLAAVEAVMNGDVGRAFCAVRPPGHHAEREAAMGFCFFDSIAVAAEYLITRHGLKRVAIVDFDVHHGNGTQHLFEDRDDVLFISVHENPVTLYPGTGFASERGTPGTPGEGYTVNVPMDPGMGDDHYRRAFTRAVLPALVHYRPEFILVSAGFDAAGPDPLAHIDVTPRGFNWMTRQLCRVADDHASGRLVSVLEGGYDLQSLGECVVAHVAALLGESS